MKLIPKYQELFYKLLEYIRGGYLSPLVIIKTYIFCLMNSTRTGAKFYAWLDGLGLRDFFDANFLSVWLSDEDISNDIQQTILSILNRYGYMGITTRQSDTIIAKHHWNIDSLLHYKRYIIVPDLECESKNCFIRSVLLSCNQLTEVDQT